MNKNKTSKIVLMLSVVCVLLLVIGSASAADDDMDVNQTDSISDEILTSDEDVNLASVDTNDNEKINVENTQGTFKDLNELLNNGSTSFVLDKDYVFDEKFDGAFVDGIQIDKSISIDGQGHSIDGKNKGSMLIFTSAVSDIVIKNITFVNAYSTGTSVLSFTSISNSLINASFINNTGQAIVRASSRTTENVIFDSEFINNYIPSDSYYGGCLVLSYSHNITVNGLFENNVALSRGILSFSLDVYNSVINAKFKANDGNSVYLRRAIQNIIINSTFENNVNNYNHTYNFSSCVMVHNGGDLYNLTILGDFINNSASTAVWITDYGRNQSDINISANFINNTVSDVVRADKSTNLVNLSITSNFEGNTAENIVNLDGENKDVSIESNIVNNNVTNVFAISNNGECVDVTQSLLTNNTGLVKSIKTVIDYINYFELGKSNFTIMVSLPFNGTVKYDIMDINNVSVTKGLINVVNGIGMSDLINIPLGDYIINLTNDEFNSSQYHYSASELIKTFTIYKPNNTIVWNNYESKIKYADGLTINVTTLYGETAKYIIKNTNDEIIKEGSIVLSNGEGSVSVNLESGDYTVILISQNSTLYYSNSINGTITVYKTFYDLNKTLTNASLNEYKLEGFYLSEDNAFTAGIVLRSNIIIDGQGKTVIDANNLGRIFTTTNDVENITIKNIKLINGKVTTSGGGAIYFTSNVDKLTIENAIFANNQISGQGVHGGAIVFVKKVSNTLINASFEQNTNTGGGTNANSRKLGGAIAFIGDVDNVTIDGEFIGNKITAGTRNQADGGAIAFNSHVNDLKIYADFINNTATTSDYSQGNFNAQGGALYFYSSVKNTVIDANFHNNQVKSTKTAHLGGAIYASTNNIDNFTISGVYDNNKAYDGAALYINTPNVSIDDAVFTNHNSGEKYTIHILKQNAHINNITIINNTGDSLCIDEDNSIITESEIINSTGNQITVNGDNTQINNTKLTNNTGTGIIINGEKVTVSNNTISDNTGTGILINGENATIINNTLNNNSGIVGAGIIVNSTNPTIKDNTFADNNASVSGKDIAVTQNAGLTDEEISQIGTDNKVSVSQLPDINITSIVPVDVKIHDNVTITINITNKTGRVRVVIESLGYDKTLTANDGIILVNLTDVKTGNHEVIITALAGGIYDANQITDNLNVREYSLTDLQNIINEAVSSGRTSIDLTQNYIWQTGDKQITIPGNLTINGNAHTIDGQNQVAIISIAGNNTVLNNIIIVNSKGIAIYQAKGVNLTLTNLYFENATSQAIRVTGENVTVKNITTINTKGSVYVWSDNGNITDINIINGTEYGVYYMGANAKITNINVTNNTNTGVRINGVNASISSIQLINNNGVGVFTVNSANCTIDDVTIVGGGKNRGISAEGQNITVSKVNIDNRECKDIGIYVDGADGVIKDVKINNVTATNSIVYVNGANGKIKNATVINSNGLALKTNKANATIEDSIILNNNGIAIGMYNGDNNVLNNINVSGNNGDAISIASGNADIQHVKINDTMGNGIAVSGADVIIEDIELFNITGVGISVDGANTIMENVTLDTVIGTGISVDGANTIMENVTLDTVIGTGISVDGANTHVSDITINNGNSTAIEVVGYNATINKVNIGNNNGNGIVVDGYEASVSFVNLTEVEGEGIKITGGYSTVNDIASNEGNGIGVHIIGNNPEIFKVNITNHTGDAIVIEGNDAVINETTINDLNGTAIDVNGENTIISNANLTNVGNGIIVEYGGNVDITGVEIENATGKAIDVLADNITISDVNISNVNEGISANAKNGNVVIDNVTADTVKEGAAITASGNNVTVKNSTLTNVQEGIKANANDTATINNVKVNGGNGTAVNVTAKTANVNNLTLTDTNGTAVKANATNKNINGVAVDGGNVKPGDAENITYKNQKVGTDAIKVPTSDSKNPVFSIDIPGGDASGTLKVLDEKGNVIAQGNVTNGKAEVTVGGLSVGKHNLTIAYSGDSKYSPVNVTASVNIPEDTPVTTKQATVLTFAKKKYTFKKSKRSKTKTFKVTLKTKAGAKLAGKTVFLKLTKVNKIKLSAKTKKAIKKAKAKVKKAKKAYKKSKTAKAKKALAKAKKALTKAKKPQTMLKQLKKGTYAVKTNKNGLVKLTLSKKSFVMKKFIGKAKLTATFKGDSSYIKSSKKVNVVIK